MLLTVQNAIARAVCNGGDRDASKKRSYAQMHNHHADDVCHKRRKVSVAGCQTSDVHYLRVHCYPERSRFINVSQDLIMCMNGSFQLYYNPSTKVMDMILDNGGGRQWSLSGKHHVRSSAFSNVIATSGRQCAVRAHFVDLALEGFKIHVERVEVTGNARLLLSSTAIAQRQCGYTGHFSVRLDEPSIFVFLPDQKPWIFGVVCIEGERLPNTPDSPRLPQADFGGFGDAFFDTLVVNNSLVSSRAVTTTTTTTTVSSKSGAVKGGDMQSPWHGMCCGGGGGGGGGGSTSALYDGHAQHNIAMLRRAFSSGRVSEEDFNAAVEIMCQDLDLSERDRSTLRQRTRRTLPELVAQRCDAGAGAGGIVPVTSRRSEVLPDMFCLEADPSAASRRTYVSLTGRSGSGREMALSSETADLMNPHSDVYGEPTSGKGWRAQQNAAVRLPESDRDDKALDVSKDTICCICMSRPPRVVCPNGCLTVCASCFNENTRRGNKKCPTCNAEGVFTKILNI